jgi:hypothetical protein
MGNDVPPDDDAIDFGAPDENELEGDGNRLYLVRQDAIDFGAPDENELEGGADRLYLVRQDETWWLHFTRNALALGLALLLGILTITILVAAIAGANGVRLMEVSQLTLTPVVALCGTAFGFYFAQQAAAQGRIPASPEPRE